MKTVLLIKNRFIEVIYNILIKPKYLDEDSSRRELVLNIILNSVNLLLIGLLITTIINKSILAENYSGINPLIFSLIVFSFILITLLSRFGYFEISSAIFIIIYFAGVTYGAYHWGPNLPAALLNFALLVVISSAIISTRMGFIMAISISILISYLGLLEYKGLFLPNLEWKNLSFEFDDIPEYAGTILVITIISWLSNRQIYKFLNRARKSEKELEYKNENLERIVIEKTEKLRMAEIEKVNELYKFAEFGRTSRNMVHDLMSPLSALSIRMSILAGKHKGNNDLKELNSELELAVKSSRKMQDYINDIRKHISFSDNEQYIDINYEIKSVINLLKSKAIINNVKVIQININSENNNILHGKVSSFHHIISNLLSNAIDSYENNSSQNKQILIKPRKKENSIEIIVKDNGCGIKEECREKIFKPFYTTKDRYKGTGIGLSATKHSLEKDFSGEISLISRPNIGTEFKVTIPIKNNDKEKSTANQNRE